MAKTFKQESILVLIERKLLPLAELKIHDELKLGGCHAICLLEIKKGLYLTEILCNVIKQKKKYMNNNGKNENNIIINI